MNGCGSEGFCFIGSVLFPSLSLSLSFQELAHVLSSIPVRVSSKKHQRSARSRNSPSKLQSRNADKAVLRRAREIARNTFDLSDAEVDALLSATPISSTPLDDKVCIYSWSQGRVAESPKTAVSYLNKWASHIFLPPSLNLYSMVRMQH